MTRRVEMSRRKLLRSPRNCLFFIFVFAILLLCVQMWLWERIANFEQKHEFHREFVVNVREGPILTIWTILRDLEPIQSSPRNQTQWLESLHTFNAVNSWVRLPRTEVILFGTKSSCDFVDSFQLPFNYGCFPIPCVHEEYNVPQYDCLFEQAKNLSNTQYLMYSNSDICYFDDLLTAIEKVGSEKEDFLMVGKRRDLSFPYKIDFHEMDWKKKFRDISWKHSVEHGPFGIDYFIYKTKLARKLPPFLVGRIRWDNWLLAEFLKDKNACVIDASSALLAIHLNHMKIGQSHLRVGTDFNKEISSQAFIDPKKIGNIESSDFRLVPENENDLHGECPKCKLIRNVQSLDVVLFKQEVDQNIIFATVDAGYLDFALNWACSLDRLNIKNYLFHAADERVFKELHSRGFPVVFYMSKTSSDYLASGTQDTIVYGSVSYQSIMNTRTEFITKILQKGYNLLLSDVDIIFLKNPFPYFDPDADIQGGAHKETKITGGFIYSRATANSLAIWNKVLAQHKEMFAQISKNPKFDIHAQTEQELLNKALLGSTEKQVKWFRIPPNIVADGDRFFIKKTTQKTGEWPAILHNNYVVGGDNKRQRFLNTSLWFIDDDMKCKVFPFYFPPFPKVTKPEYVIKVLAFDRPKSLVELLNSLASAKYDTKYKISLDIFIDHPESDVNRDTYINWNKTVAIANHFKWNHGSKRIILREQNFGLANQWLNSWFPLSSSEIAIILEDDNIVSPHYFTLLTKMVDKYYLDPSNFDPRLFGISLQTQHMIPGRYSEKKTPAMLLDKDVKFYKYQQLSTWGPVFFANHWADFLSWYNQKSSNENFLPLFSNMITNSWYLARGKGKSVWSAWFMRYAAEKGTYTLYTNFQKSQAVVVNMRRKGINYPKDQGQNSPLVDALTSEMTTFPDSRDIPIYDFHFNLIQDPIILEGRALYADIFNIETY